MDNTETVNIHSFVGAFSHFKDCGLITPETRTQGSLRNSEDFRKLRIFFGDQTENYSEFQETLEGVRFDASTMGTFVGVREISLKLEGYFKDSDTRALFVTSIALINHTSSEENHGS